jgi:hypothetical protein
MLDKATLVYQYCTSRRWCISGVPADVGVSVVYQPTLVYQWCISRRWCISRGWCVRGVSVDVGVSVMYQPTLVYQWCITRRWCPWGVPVVLNQHALIASYREIEFLAYKF